VPPDDKVDLNALLRASRLMAADFAPPGVLLHDPSNRDRIRFADDRFRCFGVAEVLGFVVLEALPPMACFDGVENCGLGRFVAEEVDLAGLAGSCGCSATDPDATEDAVDLASAFDEASRSAPPFNVATAVSPFIIVDFLRGAQFLTHTR